MDNGRLPKKAYLLLKRLDDKGKITWVTDVRKCLFLYGFGFVWLNQGVDNVKEFLSHFKMRMIDCRWQNWNEHIENSDRFEMYRMFSNSMHCVQTYLLVSMDRHLKFVLTKFRFGVSDINSHFYRYKSNYNALCQLCKEAVEDDVHFVLCCPFFMELRKEFIPEKFFRMPCKFRLAILMSSKSESLIKKVSIYLYKAFKMRELALS